MANAIGYDQARDTRFIPVTEEFAVLENQFGTANYIAFETAKVPGYISHDALLTMSGFLSKMTGRQRFIFQQAHALVSREIPHMAIVKMFIDNVEVKL